MITDDNRPHLKERNINTQWPDFFFFKSVFTERMGRTDKSITGGKKKKTLSIDVTFSKSFNKAWINGDLHK